MFGIDELILEFAYLKVEVEKLQNLTSKNQFFFNFCKLFFVHKQKQKLCQTL